MKLLNPLRNCTILLAVSLVTAAGSAQTSTWKIDPVHSGVQFRIAHMAVSHVNGRFSKITGVIHLDEKDIARSSVDATIDATTVSTDNEARDTHLKSPDFFNVAQFPTITFKSTSISKVNGKLQVTGDLTLVGVTKPVTLAVDGPAAPQKGMHDTIISGFSATGTISRKDFNLGSKFAPPTLGDEVTFTIDIEMDKQP
jgi:polyisoprenoid-binding protein YceI